MMGRGRRVESWPEGRADWHGRWACWTQDVGTGAGREEEMRLLFERLEVYRKSMDVVDLVESAARSPSRGSRHLMSQLRRAAASIPLNIAEGYGRFNPGEKKRFYLIARGSCFESIAAAELCHRSRIIDESRFRSLRGLLEEISRMLTGLIKSCDERAQFGK